MKDFKLLDKGDLEIYDREVFESFTRDIKELFKYSEELEYLSYSEIVEYTDECMSKMEAIQRAYSRKYPFLNTNRLLKLTQRLQTSILDFDFLINCVILNNLPLFDRDLHTKLKNIETWQYLAKLNYNDRLKSLAHKESLLKVSDVFFNMFMDNLYSVNIKNSYNIEPETVIPVSTNRSNIKKSRNANILYKYLELFEYMDKYTEFIDILEKVKDIVDFDEMRIFVTSYINTIYKSARTIDIEYPNLTPSIMINSIMVMITNFYESIESSMYSRSPVRIISELMSNLESGELFVDSAGIDWLTNYEIELVQILFLHCIIKDLFDYAFDRIEQVLEDRHDRYQLKIKFSSIDSMVKDRLFQASIKLVGYTLWNVFDKKVL